MSKGTLIMMHGMTGTSEKMENLARSLTPKGWSTLCPQAKIRHPTRGGFAWWLFEDGVTRDESLIQMEESNFCNLRDTARWSNNCWGILRRCDGIGLTRD